MTLALYRAYRPGTLAEVVGQDHVTAPLSRALTTGRVHHAYLFSGPRGCGKTSTARILARSLNCEQGPTPDPCGVCDSCIALAPNGRGSEDVIELDAASHGGVDDTRDLRERVIYSPARSRYRVYIIDEAHMVTTQGFNALLKVIEEPPEFVRFIFATTEPEKVLGTIRSRTFHYAFRLVSQGVLSSHLASVCQAEGVPFDAPALLLVAQASGGSVRDALSILGQLISGSGDDGLTTDYVASGLGLTDALLLDRVVSAIAARDGAEAFAAVDSVVESGHDGRRFLTDLLSRLRDLIVLHHMPDADQTSVLQLPTDQVEALRAQGALFAPAELSRAADLVSVGLSELKGATAPRLQLELLLARLMLPGADDATMGFAARLDRLERAVAVGAFNAASAPPAPPQPVADSAATTAPPPVKSAAAPPVADVRPTRRATPPPRLSDVAPATAAGHDRSARAAAAPTAPAPSGPEQANSDNAPRANAGGPSAGRASAGGARAAGASADRASAAGASAARANTGGPSAGEAAADKGQSAELASLRDAWAAVLAELGKRSRVAWAAWESSQPVDIAQGVLTVRVSDQGRLTSIRASRREELLRQVLLDVLRLDVKVTAVLGEPAPALDAEIGSASPDDPDLGGSDVSGVDLVMRELGAVPIGEIGGP